MSDDTDDNLDIDLRYVGKRFEGAHLPLDVLGDLPAFRDLLAAFAREEWLKANPDRQRVPKGFDKSLSFDLVAVLEGSAVPQLKWDRNSAQSHLPEFTDELFAIVQVSYGDVVGLVDKAANGDFPNALSPQHVRALNRFGSGLRDDERIEFVGMKGSDGNVIYLDGARRKRLITKVRETYETRFEGTGSLVGSLALDSHYGKVTVDTSTHGLIEIALDRETVIGEFDGNIGSPVQFDLQIELDNADRYRSVVQVHSVALIDERIAADLERCSSRLREVSMLNRGWDGGKGSAIDAAAASSAQSFLHKRPFLCGRYKIYPTFVGGILFEFETNGWDLSLEFSPGGAVELFGIQIAGSDELEPTRFDEVGPVFIAEFDKYAGRDGG